MLLIILYLAAAYLCAFYIAIEIRRTTVHQARRLSHRPEKTTRLHRRAAIAIVFVLCLPVVPYAVVEAQTMICSSRLQPAIRKTILVDDGAWQPRMTKVLWITPHHARVLVVNRWAPRKLNAYDVHLVKTRAKWVVPVDPDMVWSDGGNDPYGGNVFPPYRGKGEFGE
jgi:hypothetical protein